LTTRILIILPHNPGDVVMALQAIRRLKADRPGLEVDYLVGEECRELAQGNPLLRKVMTIPKRALREAWDSGDSTALMERLEAFLRDLSSTRYTLSANLFQERSGGLIQGFVSADAKIGLELSDEGNFQVKSRFLEHLFAIPAHRSGNGWHVVDIYIRAVSRALENAAGAASPQPREGKAAPPRRAENAVALLPPFIRPDVCRSLVPGGYLAFHPGSAWAGKRWPEAHWAALATLCARAGFQVAFTGSPEERPVMERILAGMEPEPRKAMVDCVGATTLAGAAWVHGHARMTITGDTVAMHLAAAGGVQTLSLFGASNPVETGPYGKGHVIIQTDASPLPDLALDTSHQGLARLRPEEVAGYLLEGIPPPGYATWESGWDEGRRMQRLSDYRRLPHPGLERALGLMDVLDRHADRNASSPVRPSFGRDDARESLRRALLASVSEPVAANLTAVEAAEAELAGETGASLVWEAYRIAINGLPLRDLRLHLARRLARFELALQEEALSSVA
jgi:ADP-heptose:LPS heptosyltransferase